MTRSLIPLTVDLGLVLAGAVALRVTGVHVQELLGVGVALGTAAPFVRHWVWLRAAGQTLMAKYWHPQTAIGAVE